MIKLYASNDYGQKGAYCARIEGTDSKFGWKREFLAGLQPSVTEAGIFEECSSTRKGKQRQFSFILQTDEGFVKCKVKEHRLSEFFKANRPLTDLRPYKLSGGDWSVIKEEKLCWGMQDTLADDYVQKLNEEKERLQKRIEEINSILGQPV